MIMTGATQDEVWPLVRDFHYSGRMPANIQHCYAIREVGGLFGDTGQIVAGVIFSIPPTRWSENVLELSRLVRVEHYASPLSSLISFAVKHLKSQGHHLLVSFADWTQRHHGGIYQASGWNYAGCRERRCDGVLIDGVFKPGRSCNSAWGTSSPSALQSMFPEKKVVAHFDEGKHLYWKALTIAGKTRAKRLSLKSLSYPKPIIDAARLLDAPDPSGVSHEHTVGAAPNA